MKKYFTVITIFALALVGCGDGNTPDNNNGNGGNPSQKITSLKITNQSSYGLFDVKYSSVDFGDMDIGVNKTMNVSANATEPIYFDLSINNNRIKCRTNEVIICDEGNTEEKIITINTVIRVVESNRTGTLSEIYNALSKPIFELKQENKIIGNNDPIPVDFGDVELTTNKSLLFTIKNVGNLPLELNGTPVILSSNAVFAIPTQPTNTSINPGASAAFLVLYTPTAEKEDSGTITIMNNSDALMFTLNIKGTGYIKRPQITVSQGNTSINQSGEFNIGKVAIGEYKDITFTIGNSGKANLIFETVNDNRINLENNTGNVFTVIAQPSAITAVTPGGTTTFTIRFNPQTIENNFTSIVKIRTNSRDYEVFSFTIKGSSNESIPVAPTGVTATALSSGSISVSWNLVSGATSYKVYYGTSNSSIAILASSTVTGNSYTHTGLQANTTYYYRVIAANGAGDSGYSLSVFATTLINAPTGVTAVAQTSSSITVSWNPVSGALNYKVYYATGSSTGNKILANTVTGTSYTHTGLQANIVYYYFIVAVHSSAGDSDYSSYASGVVFPGTPTGVLASVQSTSSIRVTWNAVSGAVSYKVYYATGSSSGTKISASSSVIGTSYSHTGLQANTTYYYFIVAVNSAGDSDYSSFASATTKLAAPTGVTATTQTTSSINVSWNPVSGATSYKVYYTTSWDPDMKILAGTVTGTSYIHTGLSSQILATTYYYYIVAVNSNNESDYSLNSTGVIIF